MLDFFFWKNKLERLFFASLFSLFSVCGWGQKSVQDGSTTNVLHPDRLNYEFWIKKVLKHFINFLFHLGRLSSYFNKDKVGVFLSY